MDQMTFDSSHWSGYDLVRRFRLGSHSSDCLLQPGSHAPHGPSDETLRADRPIHVDPVNVVAFLTTTCRGDDVWWPTHRTTRAWYENWMRHAIDLAVIQIVPKPDFLGNREYLDWSGRACWSRFLSEDELLEDPRVRALQADIRPTPSQPRPDIPLPPDAPARRRCQGGRARYTGGAVRRTQKTRGRHPPHRLRHPPLKLEHLNRGGLLRKRGTRMSQRRTCSLTSSILQAILQSDIHQPIHHHHRNVPTKRRSQPLSMSWPRLS
ncbi:hypothetical protein PIB30_047708 [Stylosanthes scabra]|uniref:Uncharacterized protein n=1 Tax=Stylosanthes scabra TaxID=79078 RepID=A0ABU6SH28_9FABA|nr:hypothetical protein [Stylosanthes scabra]